MTEETKNKPTLPTELAVVLTSVVLLVASGKLSTGSTIKALQIAQEFEKSYGPNSQTPEEIIDHLHKTYVGE